MRWGILALVTLGHASAAFAALAVAPLAPFLLDALRLSRAQIGLLLPAVYLGGVVMALPAGWLADHLGVRRALALGLGATGALVGVAALAPDLGLLLACLLVAGFGFSVSNPATGKAILEWFAPRQRGMAMGIKQTGLTLGGLSAALLLPLIAEAWSWRRALSAAGAAAVGVAILTVVGYRRPPAVTPPAAVTRPRLADLGPFVRRPPVLVVFASGFLLSTAQSSLLGYLALYARDTFAVSAVRAGQFLALAQVGGTLARLAWGIVSDRSFGGRRRPGVVASATLGAVCCAGLAAGRHLPLGAAPALAFLAGAGAFGWVGLYFALVAEIGGPRHAGQLTGVATACAWAGTLVGPPTFGLVLEATGGYAASWLGLTGVTAIVALTLPRLRPLVQRDLAQAATS